MNKKGVVSSVENGYARVMFKDMDGTITAKLPILEGVPRLFQGDVVAVIFFSAGFADGVVVGRIGGGS